MIAVPSVSALKMQVLLEKLTVSQLVQKSTAFYVTRLFITVLKTASHLPFQSSAPLPPFSASNIVMLPSNLHVYLPKVFSLQVSPPKPVCSSPIRATWLVHLIRLEFSTLVSSANLKLLLTQLSPVSWYSSPSNPNTFLSTQF